jgi:hypothetical protein
MVIALSVGIQNLSTKASRLLDAKAVRAYFHPWVIVCALIPRVDAWKMQDSMGL